MYMSKNTVKLGIAGLTAAATGAALFTAKKVNDKRKKKKRHLQVNIVIQKEENTKRTLKVFTTLMETMKHLPAQKSQLASIIRMHIS